MSSEYSSGAVSLSRIEGDRLGSKLSFTWDEGAVVWIGSNTGHTSRCVLSGESIKDDRTTITITFGNQTLDDEEIYVAAIGGNNKSRVSGNTAEMCPEYDGSLKESCFLAAKTSAGSGTLGFKPIASMIEFSISDPEVSRTVLAIEEDAFPELMTYSFSSGVCTADSFKHELEFHGTGSTFYIPVIAGVKISKFDFSFYSSDGSLINHNELMNDTAVSTNCILALGEVDNVEKEKEEECSLIVPLNFSNKKWPFKEELGGSSSLSGIKVFHTYEGFALFFSGYESYMSGNGWVVVPRNTSDFIEFPTFSKGRIASVSVKFSSAVANPVFTDSNGATLEGGEAKSSIEADCEYKYEFTNTLKGEPCKMMLNTAKKVNILEMTAEYLFDSKKDMDFSDRVTSLWLDDVADSHSIFLGMGVNASVSVQSGNVSGLRCGFEYTDYYSSGNRVQVECTPSSFEFNNPSPAGSKYLFRAWAEPESGWREYTADKMVYPNSLVLDFMRDGRQNNALESSCVKWSPADAFVLGTEGLVVSTSGGYAYLTFPAIEGKVLSEVFVDASTDVSVGSFYVCSDPSRLAVAEATMVSDKVAFNATRGTPISCIGTHPGVAYSLVFPTANSRYEISRIVASYMDAAIPDHPGQEEPDDMSADPVGRFDYKLLASSGHPRLIADSDGFAELRRKISEGKADDILLRKAHECVMHYADYYTNSTLEDIQYKFDAAGKSMIDQSRSALLQLSSMSYAYNLTGDKRYLNRARQILAQVCSFKDWNHSNFLDVAEMTLGVAIAYDWLYNSLSLEERTLIHSRIVNYALSPSYRDDYIRTQNNWNQVCAAGMIAGALAIYEKDKAISADIIERNIAGNIEMASKIYAPDGNYGEGYSYWRYGTGFQVIMMEMLESIFGNCGGMESSIEGFDKTAEYMLFMDGITGSFGYSDGGITTHGAKMAMWWFAKQQNDPSLVSKEISLLLNSNLYTYGSETRVLFLVPLVLNKYHIDNKVIQTHAKNLWCGRGNQPVVMIHTGWEWNDTDHYLGIKAGTPNAGSHAHMDNGSFVYDALGVRWSTDLGKYNYADMNNAFAAAGGMGSGQTSLRWDVLKMNNYGHSTISVNAFDGSFNKRYPSDHNYSGTVTVTSVIETATELGATLDMSQALRGQVASATRTIKLVNKQDLIVIDVVTAKPDMDAPVLWHMITPAVVEVDSDHEVLTNGGKKMFLSTVADKAVEIKYKGSDYVRPSYFTPRVWDDPEDVRIAGFECTVPAGQTVTFTTKLSPSR